MKPVFLILAAGNLFLLCVTAVVGLQVQGAAYFTQHFLLGLLSALYTCFVHVVAFTYFVVTVRIVRHAAETQPIDAATFDRFQACKSRALRWALLAIGSVLVAAALGAIVTEPPFAARLGISSQWHLAAGFITIAINLLAFAGEFAQIDANGRLFARVFGESDA